MNLWRKVFPKYNCRWCKDTGVLESMFHIGVCHHCRNLRDEIREAAAKLQKCECEPFHLVSIGDTINCAHCGVCWGVGPT